MNKDVFIENNGIKLSGTLTMPAKAGSYPAVILLQGSGPVNRDEEAFGWKPFKIIAEHLAQKGLAVLRYDSRGVGKSSGQPYHYTISDVADDTLEWVEYLKSLDKIDSSRIGLLGHSQGGIVAPLVASRNNDIAFVICLAGTGLKGEEVQLLQNASIAESEGASESQIKDLIKSQKQFIQLLKMEPDNLELRTIAESIVKKSVAWKSPEEQKKLFENKDEFNSKVECSMQGFSSTWFRFFLDYDPAPALEKIKCPILLIFGGKDMQVLANANREAMVESVQKSGNKQLTVKTFQSANHLFQGAGTGSPGEYAQLPKEFVPGLLDFISNWFSENVQTKSK